MKYIKTFENLQNEPEVGDYVVIKRDIDYSDDSSNYKEYKNYVNNNAGQVVNKNRKYLSVFYENMPESAKIFLTTLNIGVLGNSKILKVKGVQYEDVAFFSKNKEDCDKFIELQKSMKKFNI